MDTELVLLLLIGFFAQLVDGALGMAFGLISTTALITMGIPPAPASAIVHTAEIFTTGASASWNVFYRNVDWRLIARLGIAGVLGAIIGAWILVRIDVVFVRPAVSAYLMLMGLYILVKAIQGASVSVMRKWWHAPIGFIAGLLDASGGGGWGPVATSTLVGAGHSPRHAIGTVNTAEFFVTLAAAATFFFELGVSSWEQVVPLALGGLFAAPLGGWVAKRTPARALMVAVGLLVIALSLFQLARMMKLT